MKAVTVALFEMDTSIFVCKVGKYEPQLSAMLRSDYTAQLWQCPD